MLTRDFGVEIDEDEMLDELNELDEELAMEEMTGKVSGKSMAEKNRKEEEDILNDVMN